MAFVVLTRPDNSPVAINTTEIVTLAPVPTSGPLMRPIKKGTRITFHNHTHQNVVETLQQATAKIAATEAKSGGVG